MRTHSNLFFHLGLAGALAVGAVGCANEVERSRDHYNDPPPAGTLLDEPGNTGTTSPLEYDDELTPPPSATGGGPASEEVPPAAKPDASEQSAGTGSMPPPQPGFR